MNALRMSGGQGHWLTSEGFQISTLTSYCENSYASLGLGFLSGQDQLGPGGQVEICSNYLWNVVISVYRFVSTLCMSFISCLSDGFYLIIGLTFHQLSKDFFKLVQGKMHSSSLDLEQVSFDKIRKIAPDKMV